MAPVKQESLQLGEEKFFQTILVKSAPEIFTVEQNES
jgi:hypothetical protein